MNMFWEKEQDKTSEKVLNEMELSDSSLKEFHVTVIKMFTKLRRKMDKHSENFHKETENIRKYQTEVT